MPDVILPAFDISLKLKMGSLSDYDTKEALVFKNDSEFSNKYIVCAAPESDKSAVKNLITEELKSLFAGDRKLKVEINGNKIALKNYGPHIKIREIESYINTVILIGKSLG